jgi:23S rRNA G2445 N2-methylase RlmL
MKMPLLITCAPGLEKFAEKQLLEVLPGVIVNEIQRGRLFFAVETTINTLLKIKFADNIYFLVKKFPI